MKEVRISCYRPNSAATRPDNSQFPSPACGYSLYDTRLSSRCPEPHDEDAEAEPVTMELAEAMSIEPRFARFLHQ